MAIQPPGTPLGLLLGLSYAPPPLLPAPRSPTEADETWSQWSTGRSQGPRRLWSACKLAALAAMLAAMLAICVIVMAAGVWLWLGHLRH